MAISQPIHYREDSIDGSDPFIELYLELRDQLDQLHRVAESDDPRVRDFVGDIEEMIDDFNHRSQHKEYSAHSYLRNQITQAKKILRMVGQAPSKSAGRKYVEAAAATR